LLEGAVFQLYHLLKKPPSFPGHGAGMGYFREVNILLQDGKGGAAVVYQVA
jgi:hypothetical protein